MKTNAEGIIASLIIACLLLFALGSVLTNDAYHQGEKAGAKIALAIDDPAASYKASEVRASCEDLFTTHECMKCHIRADFGE